ncbi:MAG: hypothetical protein ACWGHO_03345 [Candidatus Moraniibacteriota bacterium]
MFENRTEESTISMKKEMMNSEAVQGTFGEMKEGSPVYDENGTIIPDIILKKGQKVMSLGTESKKQTNGSEGMAYVTIANEHGHFVKGVKALVPIRMIEWDSDQGKGASSKAKADWEEITNRPIDLSQIETICLSQNQSVVKINLPVRISSPGNYRIKISGNFDFFLGDHTWTPFPWQGNNKLSGSPSNKPYKDLQYGAIVLLNNGANITPTTDEGIVIFLNATSDFSVRVNAFTRNPGEWYSAKIGRMILRNSSDKPLKITIEREVKS